MTDTVNSLVVEVGEHHIPTCGKCVCYYGIAYILVGDVATVGTCEA